ncbi:MAG TPA: choice-of-anchor Q domain-containing protein, partial [Chthoniobacterales bacterium]
IRAENGPTLAATQSFTLTVIAGTPVVNSPTAFEVTATSARLRGTVQSAGTAALTRRGVIYSRTSDNANPTLGAPNVTALDDPLVTTGTFDRTATGLSPVTSYSFRVFAVNSHGTGYSDVAVFQTIALPGNGSLVVTTTADEDNGNSDPNVGAGTSLREAVAYANALGGDRTITFSPNLFANGPATITLSQALSNIQLANLSGTTTIAGPGANLLTINGNSVTRVFRLEGGAARFNGMTIANGLPQGSNDGAGIRAFGTLYVNDCVFTGNMGGRGGAIYVGGAAYISRSTFINNSATSGGAIANESTVLWIMNCTFSGNSASDQGGAFYNRGSGAQARLINCTLANNSASTAGGGLFMVNSNTVFAHNTIVSGNTAPAEANVSGDLHFFGVTSSLIDANPAAVFVNGTPAINGGTTPTIALKPGGPAINAGTNSLAVDNNSAALSTDQRGKPRVINTTVDIGAYEAPVLPTLDVSTVTNVTSTSATLGGNVTGDGFGVISKRGVVYALTSQNANPTIGGPGVTQVDASGTTGVFTVPVSGLSALSGYSFTSFATNESGTVYAPVQTFQTTEIRSLAVTISGDSANSFDAQTSLREALAYAQSLGSAQTITFAPGLAGQNVIVTDGWNNASDDTALRVSGNVTIDGGPGVTIKSLASVARRIFVNSGTLTLRNLTLNNGRIQGTNDGGALWNSGTATLDTVHLTNNTGNNGGAVENVHTLVVRNCTFSGNHSANDGGALHSSSGSQSLAIDNSTFSGNSTDAYSSAIATGAAQSTYRHLTITNNSGGGGAILLYEDPAAMVNSIVAGNTPDGVLALNGATWTAQTTNNILGSGSTGGLTNGVNGNRTGVTATQLLLGSLGNNGGPTATVPLQPGSLAIDAGVVVAGLTTDQRGTARPFGSAPDVGAFELVPSQAASIPIIGPLGGTYQDTVQVSITSTGANTLVRYTLDGSTPSSSNGQLYSGPFALTRGTTAVKAIAYGGGWIDSPVASTSYTVLTPLPFWRNLHGLPADGSQDLATPAGDGVTNLLKFAFNLAPNAGDLAKPNAATLAPNGTAGLPRVGYDGQGRLVLELVRRKASTNPGISYTVETTGDLLSWTPLSLTNATVTSIDGVWERVSVIDPTVAAKRFGRVRVELAP